MWTGWLALTLALLEITNPPRREEAKSLTFSQKGIKQLVVVWSTKVVRGTERWMGGWHSNEKGSKGSSMLRTEPQG